MSISKNLKKSLIFIAVLITVAILFMNKISNDVKLSVVKYGNKELSTQAKGIVIRDEQAVKSTADGEVKFTAQSGTRVPNGFTLARVYKKDYVGKYKKQLNSIDKKITSKIYSNNYNSAKQTFGGDISKLNANINEELKNVQTAISEDNYSSLYDIRDSINSTVKKRYNIVKVLGANEENTDVETLNKEKDHLQQLINTYEEDIQCNKPAIFSQYTDGMENKLSLVNYPKLNVQAIENIISNDEIKSSKITKARMGKTLYTMINDYNWKLLCVMTDSQVRYMKMNQPVTVFINKNNAPISAYVEQLRKAGDKFIVVINCSDMIQNVYNRRIVSFRVVKNSYGGFKVQSRAVTTRYTLDVLNNKIDSDSMDKNQTCDAYIKNEKDPIKVKWINTIGEKDKKHLIFITLDDNINLKSNNLEGLKINGNYYSMNSKHYDIQKIHGIYVFKLGVIRYCPVELIVKDGNEAIINNVIGVDPSKEIKYYDKIITSISSIDSSDVVN